MPTLVCVPILVADIPSALDAAARAKAAGADLVEFRVDDIFHGSSGKAGEDEVHSIVSLVSRSPLPCILTCRAADEAGNVGGYDGDEQARVALFERLGALQPPEHPPRYLDVELAAYTRSENVKQKVNLAVDHPAQGRDLSTSLILSTHDFQGRPADLTRRIARMHEQPAAAVHKIAYRARSVRDNLELLDIAMDSSTPTIALGIGEFGLMSRVLAPKFNAFLTFAALDRAAATAPGQPTVDDLFNLYRFRSITRSTRVYGVVGWPVEHSLSPLIHNAGFAEIGHDGVYLPIPIPPEYEHFKATILALLDHPRLDFSGCSVTIPHKENLVRLAREQGWVLDTHSELCGAANTLFVLRADQHAAGEIRVSNTDGDALLATIDPILDELGDPGGPVAVLGAGGVARSVVAALVKYYDVDVYNRDAEKARELADAINAKGKGKVWVEGMAIGHALSMFPARPVSAIVNCTSVGMSGGPAPAASPITEAAIGRSGARLVVDTVYTPRRTPLLIAAERAGIRAEGGVGMFVAQAVRQFHAWTGKVPPYHLWNGLLESRLK